MESNLQFGNGGPDRPEAAGLAQSDAGHSDAMFGRSLFGVKKTAEVKARTTDEVKFALQRKCHELGMTESEFIDRLLSLSLFGIAHVDSVEQQRNRAVAGMFPVGGPT